jgi:Cdc6-like AAA superfamily ATPase
MINNNNKKLINSFKNGIVPDHHLDFILTGRHLEIEEISRCFENTQNDIGSIKFITGPYGSGKTFLLKENIPDA